MLKHIHKQSHAVLHDKRWYWYGTGTFNSEIGSRFNPFLDNNLIRISILYFTLANGQHVLRSDARLLKPFHVLDLLLAFEPSWLEVWLRHFAFEYHRLKHGDLLVTQWSHELSWRFCNNEQAVYNRPIRKVWTAYEQKNEFDFDHINNKQIRLDILSCKN